jgi:peptidoglycan hydrolase-like protein with peptidoglycan-binding domain
LAISGYLADRRDDVDLVSYVNSSNWFVLELQQKLAEAGVSPGPVDGVLGPQTLRALATYAASNC